MKFARWKARAVGRRLIKVASPDAAGRGAKLYARLLSALAPGYRALPLVDYAAASQPIATLAAPHAFLSEAPRRRGDPPEQHRAILPALMARQFADACVTGSSSVVATQDALSIPQHYVGQPQKMITDPDFFPMQDKAMGLVRCADPRPLDSGIMVFGSGAFNWYHWLIEILPAAFLAERLPPAFADLPLLVPEACMGDGPFKASLSLFAGPRATVAMPAEATVQVKRLVLIDPVVNGPMNLRPGHWPRVSDYSQNGEVLLAYRAAILDRLGLHPARATRRIFLARSNDRRSFNQEDLIAIAGRHGFETVYPERMSFREQVQLFAETDVLLGASGAGFANMLFCQPGARGLTWLLPQYAGFCGYSNLAQVAGVTLTYLFVTPQSPLKSSFDAYSAAYVLDPAAFEEALSHLA